MSNLNELLFILGSKCYCSWNGKDQAPPAKIKQATTWRKCSFGDVTLTLSLIWMINWVMNACLLISSAIDNHASKDKHQIALWNGCEDRIMSNYMIGLTVFKILWNWYDFFFKPVMIFFLENDQIISNPFLFIVFEHIDHSFLKGLEKDLKTLKSSSLHRSVCSNIFLTLVFEKGPLMKENNLCIHFDFWKIL